MKLRHQMWSALAAACIFGFAAKGHAACTNGDVNGSSTVTTADVGAILACNGTRTSPAANPNPTVCNPLCGGLGILNCGDLNQDGAITTADAILLINEIPLLGGGPGKNVVPICASQGPTVPCGSVLDAADGDITSNRVLSNCEYFVRGTVFVSPGVVLTVRPGAVVKGVQGALTPSALVFRSAANCASPGAGFSARINASGTPTQPIVFTSDQPVGSRSSGDWGGLSFQGCSRVNVTGGQATSEGLNGVLFGGGVQCSPATGGPAGGTANCDDTSGLMRYTRIEFAGNELGPDNELNVLTQNALGAKTKFTYLQAHMGLDDGFEWFGGTIREKYFVATANRDDNFDWQLGSDIKLQYGASAQFLGNLDAQGNNGFEGDNNENGFNNLALSVPQFCNMTVVGSRGQGTHPTGGVWVGAFLRRGTAGRIAKTIITNMQTSALQLRDSATSTHACLGACNTAPATPRTDGVAACTSPANPFTLVSDTGKVCATGTNVGQACTTGNPDCPDAGQPGGFSDCNLSQNLIIRNSLFYNNGASGIAHAVNKTGGNNTGAGCNSVEWNALLTADPTLRVFENAVANDPAYNPGIQAGPTWPPVSFVPTNASLVADDPAAMMNTGFDCGASMSSFFDSTDYMGALDPNGTDWTQTPGGWISYVTQ